MDKMDKETKQEIQKLRTEINILKRCIKGIDYDIVHKKVETYDYGEGAESTLYNIRERISICNQEIWEIEK